MSTGIWKLITLQQRIPQHQDAVCAGRCSRKLEIGEAVWRHGKYGGQRHNGSTAYYCTECYENLWYA